MKRAGNNLITQSQNPPADIERIDLLARIIFDLLEQDLPYIKEEPNGEQPNSR